MMREGGGEKLPVIQSFIKQKYCLSPCIRVLSCHQSTPQRFRGKKKKKVRSFSSSFHEILFPTFSHFILDKRLNTINIIRFASMLDSPPKKCFKQNRFCILTGNGRGNIFNFYSCKCIRYIFIHILKLNQKLNLLNVIRQKKDILDYQSW